jgi:hypothetical protein
MNAAPPNARMMNAGGMQDYPQVPGGSFSPKMKWIIAGVVLLLCCISVGVGAWLYFRADPKEKKGSGKDGPEDSSEEGSPGPGPGPGPGSDEPPKRAPKKSRCSPGDQGKSEYTRRVQSGDNWVCPSGYSDTGCGWDDEKFGELQCRRDRTGKCTPGGQKKSSYTRRVQSGGNWVCPSGYTDTGCNWNDGPQLGELQCRKPK